MEIVVSIDTEPWERILDVEGVLHEGSSPNMNYGGLPQPGEPARFEVTGVEWHDTDPLEGERPMDRENVPAEAEPLQVTDNVTEFFEAFGEEIRDAAAEQEAQQYEDRWASHPDV